MYLASAQIAVAVPDFPGRPSPPEESQFHAQAWTSNLFSSALSARSLGYIIHTLHLYPQELSREPLTEVVGRMRRNVHVAPSPTGAAQLDFTYPDPSKVRGAMSLLADEFAQDNQWQNDRWLSSWQAVNGGSAPAPDAVRLNVSQISSSPTPSGIVRTLWQYALLGASLGAAIGLLLAVLVGQPRRTLRAAAWAATGFVAAAVASYSITSRYISTATLQIGPAPWVPDAASRPPISAQLTQFHQLILSDEFLAVIVNHPFETKLRANHKNEDIAALVGAMRRNLRVSDLRPAIAISFTDTDREHAQRVVNEIIANLTEWNVRARRACAQSGSSIDCRIGANRAGENLEVLDPASMPELPVGPNRFLICLCGAAAGLAFGVWRTRRDSPPNSSAASPAPGLIPEPGI